MIINGPKIIHKQDKDVIRLNLTTMRFLYHVLGEHVLKRVFHVHQPNKFGMSLNPLMNKLT